MSLGAFLFILKLATLSASGEPLSCQDTAYGRSCQLSSQAGQIAVTRTRVLVGATDVLFSFTIDLSRSEFISLIPNGEIVTKCKSFNADALVCKNYIKVIVPLPAGYPLYGGRVFVCGTNAKLPRCTFFNPDNLADSSQLSGPNSTEPDSGFCPFEPSSSVASLAASNGYFYSGTKFTEYTAQGRIGVVRNISYGDKTFSATPIDFQTWVNSYNPTFVSAYELKGFVYFLLSERADEEGSGVIHSRVVRICLNDSLHNMYGFQTFQKARIVCTNSPNPNQYLAYDYNELKATALVNGALYGAFSSPESGPRGAALCKFSFDAAVPTSIPAAFAGNSFLVKVGENWQKLTASPVTCAGKSRTSDDITNRVLLMNPIRPSGSVPLLQVVGTTFTAIAADVFSSFGATYEVLYYALEGGGIEQLIITGQATYKHRFSDSRIETGHLSLRVVNNTRLLYAASNSSLDLYVFGNCSRYKGCRSCLESKDPYCVWDVAAETCASSWLTQALSPQHAIEGFTLTDPSVICKIESTSPFLVPSPSTNFMPSGTLCTILQQVPAPTALGNEFDVGREGSAGGEVAGATIGGFVVGLPLGIVLCAFALFIKRTAFASKVSSDETQKTPTNISAGSNASDAEVSRYIPPPIDCGNSQESDWDNDDVIVELGTTSNVGRTKSQSAKERTESTTWLRASETTQSPM